MRSDFSNQNSIELIQKYRVITLNFEILTTPSHQVEKLFIVTLQIANGCYKIMLKDLAGQYEGLEVW